MEVGRRRAVMIFLASIAFAVIAPILIYVQVFNSLSQTRILRSWGTKKAVCIEVVIEGRLVKVYPKDYRFQDLLQQGFPEVFVK